MIIFYIVGSWASFEDSLTLKIHIWTQDICESHMIDNYNVLEVIDNIDYKIYMYNKLMYKKRVYYQTLQLEDFLFQMLEIKIKIKLPSFLLSLIPLVYMNRKHKPLIHFRMNNTIVLAKECYGWHR